MVILTEITKWVDQRDSKQRVHPRDTWEVGFRLFILNPNRISDLKVHGTGSSFLFSDNHRDRRENNSFLISNSTVAEIEAAHNTAYHSKFVTLPFFPKNNPHRTPVNTTLDVEDIAYFDDYNDPDHPDCCWLVYNRKAFRRVEQLVRATFLRVPDILLTGTTSTTTTSPPSTTAARTTSHQ
jgi:hypothetical protein